MPAIIDCESKSCNITFIDVIKDKNEMQHYEDHILFWDSRWHSKIKNGIKITLIPSKYSNEELINDDYLYCNQDLLLSIHKHLNYKQMINYKQHKSFKVAVLNDLRSESTFKQYINGLKSERNYNLLTILIHLHYNISNGKLSLDSNDSNNNNNYNILAAMFIMRDNNNNSNHNKFVIKTCVLLTRQLWAIGNNKKGPQDRLKNKCQAFCQYFIYMISHKITPYILKEDNTQCKIIPFLPKSVYLLYFWEKYNTSLSNLKIRHHFCLQSNLFAIEDIIHTFDELLLEDVNIHDIITGIDDLVPVGITSYDGIFNKTDIKSIMHQIEKHLNCDSNLPHFLIRNKQSLENVQNNSTLLMDNLIGLNISNCSRYKEERHKIDQYEQALNGLNAFTLKTFINDNDKNINIDISNILPKWWLHLIYYRFKQLNMHHIINKYHFSFIYESPLNCNSFKIPLYYIQCGKTNIQFQNCQCILMVFCDNDVCLYCGDISFHIICGRIYFISYDSLNGDNITIINNKHKCYIIMLRNNAYIKNNNNDLKWYDINQFKENMIDDEIFQIGNAGDICDFYIDGKVDVDIGDKDIKDQYQNIINKHHLRIDFEKALWRNQSRDESDDDDDYYENTSDEDESDEDTDLKDSRHENICDQDTKFENKTITDDDEYLPNNIKSENKSKKSKKLPATLQQKEESKTAPTKSKLSQTVLRCKEFIFEDELRREMLVIKQEFKQKLDDLLDHGIDMDGIGKANKYLKNLLKKYSDPDHEAFRKDIFFHIGNNYENEGMYIKAIKYYMKSLKIFKSTETVQRLYFCETSRRKQQQQQQKTGVRLIGDEWINLLIECCNHCLSNKSLHIEKRKEWLTRWTNNTHVKNELMGGSKCALHLARYFEDKYGKFNDYSLIWYKSALNILELCDTIYLEDAVVGKEIIDSYSNYDIIYDRETRKDKHKIDRKRMNYNLKDPKRKRDLETVEGILQSYQQCLVERFIEKDYIKDCIELHDRKLNEFECFYEWHNDNGYKFKNNFETYLRRELDSIFEINYWSFYWDISNEKKTKEKQREVADCITNYGIFIADVIKNYQCGLIWYHKAQELNKDDPVIAWNIAEAQENVGKYIEARKMYQQIVENQSLPREDELVKEAQQKINDMK